MMTGTGAQSVGDLEITGAADYEDLMVNGTLFLHGNAVLTLANLNGPPGSKLVLRDNARILFKNRPPDDTAKSRTGLVWEGHVDIQGRQVTRVLRLAIAPKAGDDRLHLVESAADWLPNDLFVIPDSRQLLRPTGDGLPWDHIEERHVANFEDGGRTLVLDKPLSFDHPASFDSAGNLFRNPHVINRTGIMEVRTGDPAGVRAHVMFMGYGSKRIVKGCAWRYLGRTSNDPDDPANIIGRYALHFHKSGYPTKEGEWANEVSGNLIEWAHPCRWGLVCHNTHFSLFEGNVVIETAGAGVVTEAGNEVGNLFRGNFAVSIHGRGPGKDGDHRYLSFGGAGDGHWYKSPYSAYEENYAANCNHNGFTLWNMEFDRDSGANAFPLGRDLSEWSPNSNVRIGRVMHQNEAYGCMPAGHESWGNAVMTISKPISWHTHVDGTRIKDGMDVTLEDATSVHDSAQMDEENQLPVGLRTRDYYPPREIVRPMVHGGCIGLFTATGSGERDAPTNLHDTMVTVTDPELHAMFPVRLENEIHYGVDDEDGPGRIVFVRPLLVPIRPDKQPLALSMFYGGTFTTNWFAKRHVFMIDYQREKGDSFQVFWNEQAPDFAVPFDPGAFKNPPRPGMTNRDMVSAGLTPIGGRITPCLNRRPEIDGFVCEIMDPMTMTRQRTWDVRGAIWGDATYVQGWIQDEFFRDIPVPLIVSMDGKPIGKLVAGEWNKYVNQQRGSFGFNGFTFGLPKPARDGQPHQITIAPDAPWIGSIERQPLTVQAATPEPQDPEPPTDPPAEPPTDDNKEEIMATVQQLTEVIGQINTLGAQRDQLEATRTHLEDHLIEICSEHVDPADLAPIYDGLTALAQAQQAGNEATQQRITDLQAALAAHGVHEDVPPARAQSDVPG